MSFWTYLRPSDAGPPGEATIGSMLRDLHAVLHLTIWYALYAERLPDCRQRAAELLASWRTP